ncbi:MAG: DUF1801 domain-containing protein [Pseudomonadota bacterium]
MSSEATTVDGVIPEFQDESVAATFAGFAPSVRSRLTDLRALIFDVATKTEGVGPLQETLKWGQPSFLTPKTKSGSTIRIDAVPGAPDRYALYFICHTNLVETFREVYPTELTYGGNRSILLDASNPLPEAPLRHCIALALTYHSRKKARR